MKRFSTRAPLAVAVAMTLAVAAGAGCHRPAPAPPAPKPPATAPGTPPEFAADPLETREGKALWYDVPASSLAARRGGPGEMTAASDKLPQGAYVRVTRLDPDKDTSPKPVVVRITDHGVGRKDALVEVDREAAQALWMVKDGMARVRVEVLTPKDAPSNKP